MTKQCSRSQESAATRSLLLFSFYLLHREVNFKNDFTLLEIKFGDKKRTFCQQDSKSRNMLFCGDVQEAEWLNTTVSDLVLILLVRGNFAEETFGIYLEQHFENS